MHTRPTPRRTADGFTLVELMVVVVILSVLASLVVPRFMDRPDEARAVKVRQDIQSIQAALDLYRLDNHSYPSTEQGLDALVERPAGTPPAPNWKAGGYLPQMPEDPWGRPYLYLNPGLHAEIDLYSQGRDGEPGGEGIDADVGNWAADT